MRWLFTYLMLGSAGCGPASDQTLPPPTPYQLTTPAFFPNLALPSSNPLTEEGIDLGRALFHDRMLSLDNTVSCADCHQQSVSFSDARILSLGVDGKQGKRHSMPLINLAWATSFFWDGRAPTLEQQALAPIKDRLEMNETMANVILKLREHDEYPKLFASAFGDRRITGRRISQAIAQFERTLISANSRYDRYLVGAEEFTEEEKRGLELFNSEKAECFHCHGTALFTDHKFHNNGLDEAPSDLGRALFTNEGRHRGLFKTPTLRNIAVTAPYMHDGRFSTLAEVIDFYDSGVKRSATLDPLMQDGRPLELSDEEKAALIAFLSTLTDEEFLQTSSF